MLEFHKLTGQVDQMGQYLAEQEEDIEVKLDIALKIMEAHADPAWLPYINERVRDAVEKDAGYRGARLLDEPLMQAYPPAKLPESATVVATDGSQILPNRHNAATYYLINIGTMILHHGSGQAPKVISQPYLFYESEYVYPQNHGLISTATVSARRTVNEMAALAEQAWLQREETRPLVALLDNPLLFVMGNEVPDRDQLRKLYFSAMTRLLEVQASLAGYVDKPGSTFVIRLLHLLDLPEEEVRRATLASSGRLEGLMDSQLFRGLLRPGERSALFVQMSPQNKEFRNTAGELHEVAFFYMNVAAADESAYIARVDVPMWVAQDRAMVAELQSLVYHQCQQLPRRYPYVLTRAHELAVVKSKEAQQLNVIIQVAMTRYGLDTDGSAKQASKDLAGRLKTRFEMR
jgi:hypothetical protein